MSRQPNLACDTKNQADGRHVRGSDDNAPLENVMANVRLGANSVKSALQNAKKRAPDLGMVPLKRKNNSAVLQPSNLRTIETVDNLSPDIHLDAVSEKERPSVPSHLLLTCSNHVEEAYTKNVDSSLIKVSDTTSSQLSNTSVAVPLGHKIYTTSQPSNNIFRLRVISDNANVKMSTGHSSAIKRPHGNTYESRDQSSDTKYLLTSSGCKIFKEGPSPVDQQGTRVEQIGNGGVHSSDKSVNPRTRFENVAQGQLRKVTPRMAVSAPYSGLSAVTSCMPNAPLPVTSEPLPTQHGTYYQ